MIQSVILAKGIGIILVVIGHYCPDNCPAYWKYLRILVYKFHMPLFFVLSGYLYGRLGENRKFGLLFIKKKNYRLIVPFFTIALVGFILKYSSGFFFELEYPVSIRNLFSIFITKEHSYFPLLWFVYSLFIIFIIHPVLEITLHSKPVVFAVTCLFMLIDWPQYFYLKHVFKFLPFFSFGALYLKKLDLDRLEFKNVIFLCALGVAIFIAASFFFAILNHNVLISASVRLIWGISGSISIISIAVIIVKSSLNKLKYILGLIGSYSMSIYLLHSIFSSFVRIINYQVIKSNAFVFPALIAIAAGIFIPLILEKWVLRKSRFSRKYVLGLA